MRLRHPAALTAIRLGCGLTQRDLAAQVGCSRGTIGDLESGRLDAVSDTLARAIAKALRGVDVELLFVASLSSLSAQKVGRREQPGRVA